MAQTYRLFEEAKGRETGCAVKLASAGRGDRGHGNTGLSPNRRSSTSHRYHGSQCAAVAVNTAAAA